MSITSPKNFLKVLQLNANGICNKTDKIQICIKNTHADVMSMQETKLNQSYKTPNIPHFTPIRTDHTHKQGGGLLIYNKNRISFTLNILNTSHIELQIIKIHSSASQQLHIADIYIPPKHSTQLSQTEENLIISSTFTTTINLPNTIITANINNHLSIWYSAERPKRKTDRRHFV